MDQGLREAPTTTRWLAWVVACLLLAGLLSAGILVATEDRPGSAVVNAAAGSRAGTIDVTSTVTVPLPPSSPPTTLQTTTTLPRAAMDVLNAITTTTIRPRATTTTRPPAPTTTVPRPTPTTAAPATSTSTTVPRFTATLVNNHPHAFVLVVNGREFPLEPGQTTEPVDLPVARGDLIQVRLPGEDKKNCGVSDSGVIFQAGSRYRVTIVTGPGMCGNFASPLLEILRLS